MRIDAIFKFYYKIHRHGSPERSNSSLEGNFAKVSLENNWEKKLRGGQTSFAVAAPCIHTKTYYTRSELRVNLD